MLIPADVLHVVLQGQVSIERLQVIRQAVVGAAKIVAFVFDAELEDTSFP